MKRILLLALALLFCLPAALAESDGYWTTNDDWYYHLSAWCGGADGMVPISLNGAEAFGKYPCPVCVPEEGGAAEIQVVVRGGTVILRVPDAWMDSLEMDSSSFYIWDEKLSGAEADEALSAQLHGEAYAQFVSGFRQNGSAEAWVRVPGVGRVGDIVLSQRHLGGAWCFALLPERLNNSWNVELDINGRLLQAADGVLNVHYAQEAALTYREVLQLIHAYDAERVFAREGGVEVGVYRAQGMNIAAIYQRPEDKNRMLGARLYIGGVDTGAKLNGWLNEETELGFYCCVLTDAELHALQEGAEIELHSTPITQGADFGGSPYAVVETDAGSALIDREGGYVIEPGRYSISRPNRRYYPTTAVFPVFCSDGKGNTAVLNGETLDPIVKLSDEYYFSEYVNPAVMLAVRNDVNQWLSLEDGSVLFELTESWNVVVGQYAVLTDASPERMVCKTDAERPNARSWLIDNRGQRVSDAEYQELTPLIWWQGKGVFLVESFDPDAYPQEWTDDMQISFTLEHLYSEESSGPYAGTRCGPSWRCGLIDQDGNGITEVKYTSIEALDGGTFRLGTEDGGYETVTPVPIPAGW